jgi:Protein of unknown function (DUF3105)
VTISARLPAMGHARRIMSWSLPEARAADAKPELSGRRLRRGLALWLSLALAACAADDAADGSPDAAPPAGDGGLAACEPCPDCVEAIPVTSANHVQGTVNYPDPPPVGGDHNPCWAPWGVHAEAVPAERWVHNLEHGGVAFLYACSPDCPEEQAVLETLVRSNPRTLLTPYPQLQTRFAVVAWGQRLQTDCLDASAFLEFYTAHYDHGPESIASPPPAGCE